MADLVILAAIGLIQAWFIAGDFDVRLAQPPQDESPVAHSYYFASPDRFRLDAYMNAWSPVAQSSIINWLPAILFKHLGVQPELFFTLFALLQTALLGCALYYLALVIFDSRGLAWLTALFALMWRPQWLNLAIVGGLDWMPYANWLALPFLILAIALTIKRHIFAASVLLVTGALIHPIMSAITSLMVVAYFIVEPGKLVVRRVVLGGGIGLLIALVAFLPAYVAISGIAAVPNTNQLNALLSNVHVNPLAGGYPFGVAALANAVIWITGLFIIAESVAFEAGSQGRLVLRCVGVTAALTSALHVLSVLLHFAPVMNIIASRSTILLLLVCLPFVMRRLTAELASGMPVRIISALIVIFSCSALSLLAILTLSPSSREFTRCHRGSKIREGAENIVALSISALVLIRHVPGYGPWIDANVLYWLDAATPWLLSDNRAGLFDWNVIWACLGMITIASIAHRFAITNRAILSPTSHCWGNHAIVFGVGMAMIYATSVENIKTGIQETSGTAYDYYLAQVWARDSTTPDAAFINVGVWPTNAWRGVSKRQSIVTFRVGDVYVSTSEAQRYNFRMGEFMARHSLQSDDPAGWSSLGVDEWGEFRKEFGGDFLVRKSSWHRLPLPIVYRNSSIVIHALAG